MPTESEIRKKTFQEIIDYLGHSPSFLSENGMTDIINTIIRGPNGITHQLKCLGNIDQSDKEILINGELTKMSNEDYCKKVLLKIE